MIARPKTSETPTAPSAPWCTVSVTIAPQPAKTRAKAPQASATARRSRSGRPSIDSAAGSGDAVGIGRDRGPRRHREHLAHRVERSRDEAEVAVGAACLACGHAGVDQLLEVVADR